MDNPLVTPTEWRPALVGREAELAFLQGKLEEAAQGKGAVVVVSGEAGVGKTRLIEELGAQARARGLGWLCGAGDARGPGLAYGLFVAVLQGYLEGAFPAERSALAEIIAQLAPHLWERLFPGEKPPAPEAELNPQLRQSLFLARLRRLLVERARQQPVVLCLEDLHWADSASLQVVRFLVSRPAEAPLLVVGTCRPQTQAEGEAVEWPRLVQELHRHGRFHLLRLEPLSAEDTRALVASCLGQVGFSEELMDLLCAKSGGMPFFLVHYLEFLREQGLVYEEGGVWLNRPLEELEVPDSLRAALQQRLGGLGAQERELLSYAAVQGEVFEGRRVAQALGRPYTQVLRALSALARHSGLIRSEGRHFCFAHALLTQTVYEFLPEAQRRQAHLRVAHILQAQGTEEVEGLAYHFHRAGAFAQAFPYLLAAARQCRGAYAYGEARRFLLQAEEALAGLEAAQAQPQRLEVTLLLAEVEERTGNPERGLSLCRQALGLAGAAGDRAAQGQALMQMGWVHYRKRDWQEAVQHYREALALFAELGDEQRCAVVQVRLGNIAFERSQWAEAEAQFRAAKSAAVKSGCHGLLGTICGNLGVIASVRGQYLEAILHYTEALKTYRQANHKYGLCQTYHNLGMTHAAQKEWQTALNCYAEGAELAQEMGTVDVAGAILVSQAVAQLGGGDVEGAAASCRQARVYMEQLGDRLGLAECRKVEGMLCRERGQYGEAEARLEAGRQLFAELENRLGVAECEVELGLLLHRRGDAAGARQRLRQAQRLFAEIGALAEAHKTEELLIALEEV